MAPVIPANVKIDQRAKFQGQHDGDMVREFVRAMDSFFALAGKTDITWQVHFASTRLSDNAAIWLENQAFQFGAGGHTWP